METAREEEGPGLSHSDEEECGDLSDDEEAVTSEREGVIERVEPGHQSCSEDHGLGVTARGSNLDHVGREETAITSLSSGDERLKENVRSSAGSGEPSAPRSVSVETGLRNLKVSEGNASEEGEKTLFMPSGPRSGFSVGDDYFDVITPYFVNPRAPSRSR